MKKNEKIKSMINTCNTSKSMIERQIFERFYVIERYCDYAKERISNGIVDDCYINTIEFEIELIKRHYNRYKTEEEKIQQLEALNK